MSANFHNFDPYPPTIGIPSKCLWRGFLILMHCDLLTIDTWGHPSPLRHADVLNGWSLIVNIFILIFNSNEQIPCLMQESFTKAWTLREMDWFLRTKGQIISKQFLVTSDSSKNERTNSFFWHNSTKTEFVRSFFWKNPMIPKSPFEIIWP
jgi:hypothetical protein